MTFPEMYDRWLVGPLFRPFAEALVERARLATGDRVLDIACGTGIVARLAAERVGDNGHVIGVDISPHMIALARTLAPGVEWREGNACALPVDEVERFDVVLCQQGLQFFADKPAAVAEMRRALEPGGRVLVAVWKSLDETPFFQATHQVAERRLGAVVDRRHSLGDLAALWQLMTDAGFADVHVESVARTIRVSDPAMFVRMNTMALVGMSTVAPSLSVDERARLVDAVVADSADVVRQYSTADGLAFELATHLATGH